LSTFDVDPLMFLLIPSEPSLSNFDASHDVSADLSQHPSLSTLDVIHWCYSNWSFTATHPVDLDVFFCILARCFPLTVTGTCLAGQTLTIPGPITFRTCYLAVWSQGTSWETWKLAWNKTRLISVKAWDELTLFRIHTRG
jgi:hypothetical protein